MTKLPHWLAVAMVLISTSAALSADAPKQRTFLFTYSGAVTALPAGVPVRIWLPMAVNSDAQKVELLRQDLPATPRISDAPTTGNRYFYFDATADKPGAVAFSITYRITRRELSQTPVAKSDDPARYLAPDKLVPVGGKPAQVMLAGKTVPTQPMSAGRFLYDLVDDAMQYRKDKPGWGHGDAAWACESRFGNCTDFHSLFISLARTEHIPAKFDIGFAIPPKPASGDVPGYHCWALFMADGKWVPVDISEANQDPAQREYDFGHLDADRVMFTTGRDLTLIPPQAGPPLNFFIYPYAEVAGKPWPADKITHAFHYEDVK